MLMLKKQQLDQIFLEKREKFKLRLMQLLGLMLKLKMSNCRTLIIIEELVFH